MYCIVPPVPYPHDPQKPNCGVAGDPGGTSLVELSFTNEQTGKVVHGKKIN